VNRGSSVSNPAPANIFSGVSLKTDSDGTLLMVK